MNREKRFLIEERVYENKIRTIRNYVNVEAQKLCPLEGTHWLEVTLVTDLHFPLS